MAATEAGSAAGAVLEGFLSGVERGQAFQQRRTLGRQTAEELERRREQAELDRTRQGVIDEREGARAEREARRFDIDIFEQGLEPLPEGVTPGAPTTPTGRPRDLDVIGMRDRLREGVGDQLAPGAAAPPGFRRIGPSEDQLAQERSVDLRRRTGEFLADPEAFDISDPRNIEALEESDLLDDLLRQREAASRPDPTSPLQRITGQRGFEFTFDPRGEPGERVAPLLGPEGEQFRSRVPADTFARQNAQSAANAISRIDPFAFSAEEAALEPDRVAQRFGFRDASHVQETLSAAIAGDVDEEVVVDVESRARELRAQGLSDDEVIAKLRSEGLISG